MFKYIINFSVLVSCGVPVTVPNGVWNTTNGVLLDAVAVMNCNNGYVEDSKYSVCLANRSWSQIDFGCRLSKHLQIQCVS